MKRIFILAIILLLPYIAKKSFGQVENVGTTATRSADQHANNDINSTLNSTMDKAEGKFKGLFKKKKKGPDSTKNAAAIAPGATPGTATAVGTQSSSQTASPFTTYQNYDFVPGEKIIFEDDFSDDQDGEFPTHWKLLNGQAVINKVDAKPSLLLSEYKGEIMPRMKTVNYLPDAFTFEFDFIYKKYTDAGYLTNYFSDALGIEFYYKDSTNTHNNPSYRVVIGRQDVKIDNLDKSYPDDLLSGFDEKMAPCGYCIQKRANEGICRSIPYLCKPQYGWQAFKANF